VSGISRLPLRLDIDALSRAFFRRLDNEVHLVICEARETLLTFVVSLGSCVDRLTFTNIGESVVEEHENIRGNLFAESVARTEILIDPDLHHRSLVGNASESVVTLVEKIVVLSVSYQMSTLNLQPSAVLLVCALS
jgi:hypothetical protein